ncbi:MAG TPA: MIP/aquaporin family protein [Candidatus Dormibacteraeota bacterium]|nr:MIP/aquaporin family protein [Candidatus Dormibacteraeota bacterium]
MDTMRSRLAGELMSEFLGTFVLIAFGDGVVAMAVAALNQSGRAATPHTIFLASGDWLLIVFGWAFAVMLGVYVAGGISGAHINPAVTLAFAVRGTFPWNKVIPYWVAQWLGAFLAAGLVYAVYGWAIHSYLVVNHLVQSKDIATYSIFATFPAPYFTTWWGPLIDQVVGTAFLLMLVAALIDRRNLAPRSNLLPMLIGFVVAAIGASYGANAGYAINPARDFGPRVWAWVAGWGQLALPGNYPNLSWYFWIPIVGPFIGGVLGVLVYDFFIKSVLVARGVPEAAD